MALAQRKFKYWVWGTITAFLGVAVVRLLPDYYPQYKTYFLIGGVNIALLGLFIISLGTRRRKDK